MAAHYRDNLGRGGHGSCLQEALTGAPASWTLETKSVMRGDFCYPWLLGTGNIKASQHL